MRIGIMGGTLDPIHRGHIEIATGVMRAMELDKVMLLPAGDPPHKNKTTPKADRLRMVEIAAQAHEGLFVSDVEINREGTTYTVDTLSQFRHEQPDVEWVYIVGADTLDVLDSWKKFSKVAGMCTFAAVGRPGSDDERSVKRAKELHKEYGAKIVLLNIDGPDISSTDVRNLAAEGGDISHLVPEGVAEYIREHGLYMCDYSEKRIIEKLGKHISRHRLEHTIGVADTAQRLAERYGLDPHRARLAALLHDCAKGEDFHDLKKIVKGNVPDVDKSELESKAVLHAPAGMIIAREKYGVRDPEILSAIRKHTVGSREMSRMDALIFTADFIEPGRKEFPGLEKARQVAETDIYKAMCICAQLTIDYVRSQGGEPHPRTAELLESYSSYI